MPIQPTEIKLYAAEQMHNEATNGGRMSANLIVSGVKNNIFPDVPDAERLAGSTKYRKVFWKVENPTNTALQNVKVYMTKFTNGDDWITFFAGTQIDTQADITGNEREYGVGALATDLSAGMTSFDVTLEDTTIANIFQTGDTIWIGDGTNEEFHTNVTVSVTGNVATITLDTNDSIGNSFSGANTVVASCLTPADITVSYDGLTITSTSGTFDDTNYPILLNSVSTVEDTWTITFTSATTFDCVGAAEGAVGSGDTSTDFAPDNPDFTGNPFFTIQASAWGGTWAAGDTLVFATHPASTAIWFKRVVPAGAGTVYNTFAHAIAGDSV